MWNMMNPRPSTSADTNSQLGSENSEAQTFSEQIPSDAPPCGEDVSKPLACLYNHYKTIFDQYENIIKVAILRNSSLKLELSNVNEELDQVHVSDGPTEDERSSEETEHVNTCFVSSDGISENSSDCSDHSQKGVNRISIIVNIKSKLKEQENRVERIENELEEMQSPISNLKENLSKVHEEVNVQLQLYLKRNQEEKRKQREKIAELEESCLKAEREIVTLRELTKELEQELNSKVANADDLRLQALSQQVNSLLISANEREHVDISEPNTLTNPPDVINQSDLIRVARIVSQEPTQQQKTDITTRRQAEIEELQCRIVNLKMKLTNSYKYLLGTLKLNESLREHKQKNEEHKKEQIKKITKLEEDSLNDKREITNLNDLIEAMQEELEFKNNQLKYEKNLVAEIQRQLEASEKTLTQIRRVPAVDENSSVQVVLETHGEVYPADNNPHQISPSLSIIEEILNEETECVDEDPINDDQNIGKVTISNNQNVADMEKTDIITPEQSAVDHQAHNIIVCQRREQEMNDKIAELNENLSTLLQELSDARKSKLQLQTDLENIEKQKQDEINALGGLNENLQQDLQDKDMQLKLQQKQSAEKLSSSVQELTQKHNVPEIGPSMTQNTAQLTIEQRLDRLEENMQKFDQELASLNHRLDIHEVNTLKLSLSVDKLKHKMEIKSKTYFNEHMTKGFITELKNIRKFMDRMRIENNGLKKEVESLKLEIVDLNRKLLTGGCKSNVHQSNGNIQLPTTGFNPFTIRKNQFSSPSQSSREHQQTTLQDIAKPSCSQQTIGNEASCSKSLFGNTEVLPTNIPKLNTHLQENVNGFVNKIIPKQNDEKTTAYNNNNHEQRLCSESRSTSVSGMSTPKSYPSAQVSSSGISSEESPLEVRISGRCSPAIVERFLNHEREAYDHERSEEESIRMSGQSVHLKPVASCSNQDASQKAGYKCTDEKGFDDVRRAISKKKKIKSTFCCIFSRKRRPRQNNGLQNENMAQNRNSDSDAAQNESKRECKRGLLLKKLESGASFTSWSGETIGIWLEQWVGMPDWFVNICRKNIKSGSIMITLTDTEIQTELGITNTLHRLKLRLAVQEIVSLTSQPSTKVSRAIQGFRVMNHEWIANYWLSSLGLSQYQSTFMNCLVDARMLNHLTKENLKTSLEMTNKFHRISFYYGVTCLKMLDYDCNLLEERRKICQNSLSDVLVWTNDRVMKWIASIGLEAWGNNLAESGVHGAIIALNRNFDYNCLASLLQIPDHNFQARRTLSFHFDNLLRTATDRQ